MRNPDVPLSNKFDLRCFKYLQLLSKIDTIDELIFIYPSKLAAHLSSYPDHCLIHPNSVKSGTPLKKDKAPSPQLDSSLFHNSEGINEKDLIIIDDFINALLSNKIS